MLAATGVVGAVETLPATGAIITGEETCCSIAVADALAA